MAFVVSMLFMAPSVFAQEVSSAGTSIAPPVIDVTANPGETVVKTIQVSNTANVPQAYTFSVAGFQAFGELGEAEYFSTGEIVSWSTISPQNLTLEGGESVDVVLTMQIPDNAAAGGYYATVFAKTSPEPTWELGSTVGQMIGANVMLTVGGSLVENAEITEFSIPQATAGIGERVAFTLRVTNIGNVHVAPQGYIDLYRDGKNVAQISINETGSVILPGTTRDLSVSSDILYLPGTYSASVSLTYGGGKTISTEDTIDFVVRSEYSLLIVLTVVLALFVGALIPTIFSKKKRRLLALLLTASVAVHVVRAAAPTMSASLGASKPETATSLRLSMTTTQPLPGDDVMGDDDGILELALEAADGSSSWSLPDFLDVDIQGLPEGITSYRGDVIQETSTSRAAIVWTFDQTSESGTPVEIPAGTTLMVVLNNVITPEKVADEGMPDIYEVTMTTKAEVTALELETASTSVAILDVARSGMTVGTALSLTVVGTNSATSAFGVQTDVTTSAFDIPFGELETGASKEAAQSLKVSTNVPQGYVLSVFADKQLTERWKYGSTDKDVFAMNEWAAVPVGGISPPTGGLVCTGAGEVTNEQCLSIFVAEIPEGSAMYSNKITYVLVPKY